MGKKKSSYQKLKEENARLRQDIYEIVAKGNITVIASYKFQIQLEKAIWSGSVNHG